MPNKTFEVNPLFDAEGRVVEANYLLKNVWVFRVHVVLNHDAVRVVRLVLKVQSSNDVGMQLNVDHVCTIVTLPIDVKVPLCGVLVPDLVYIIVDGGKVSNINVLLDASRVETHNLVADC